MMIVRIFSPKYLSLRGSHNYERLCISLCRDSVPILSFEFQCQESSGVGPTPPSGRAQPRPQLHLGRLPGRHRVRLAAH